MPVYIAKSKGFYQNRIVKIGEKVSTDKPLDKKPSWLEVVQSTVVLSPQQKAAATRATTRATAAAAAAAAAAAETPDFSGNDEPERI